MRELVLRALCDINVPDTLDELQNMELNERIEYLLQIEEEDPMAIELLAMTVGCDADVEYLACAIEFSMHMQLA